MSRTSSLSPLPGWRAIWRGASEDLPDTHGLPALVYRSNGHKGLRLLCLPGDLCDVYNVLYLELPDPVERNLHRVARLVARVGRPGLRLLYRTHRMAIAHAAGVLGPRW